MKTATVKPTSRVGPIRQVEESGTKQGEHAQQSILTPGAIAKPTTVVSTDLDNSLAQEIAVAEARPLSPVDLLSSSSRSLSPIQRPLSPVQRPTSPFAEETLQQWRKEMEELQQEHTSVKQQLQNQQQVNADLKRLLVASVGDDLEDKLSKLAEERRVLDRELELYNKRTVQDTEHLQFMNIQADVWRSKFLATRLMVDELAGWKARLYIHYRECRHALKLMMLERAEMRQTLLDTHRTLRMVKDCLDPDHQYQDSLPVSMDTLSLAESNAQLSDKLRYHVTGTLPATEPRQYNLPDTDLTPSEALAAGILSTGNSHAQLLEDPLPVPPSLRLANEETLRSLYNPNVRYENITYTSCPCCLGDIQVV